MLLLITVSAHIDIYMYMFFAFFYISRSLVVLSVDHLNMNKLLTTDYLPFICTST